MRDRDCVAFLQHWLPRLGLSWPGYRKVRGTVCKRIRRRLGQLGLPDLEAYGAALEASAAERARLDAFCRIPISRFWRDRGVYEALGARVLPGLARRAAERGDGLIRCWSAGCASGEEPYGLALLWAETVGGQGAPARLHILASDAEPVMLARAAEACYSAGSLKELPPELRARTFVERDGSYCLRSELKAGIDFVRQDLRRDQPEGSFDLILCRNLAFTYFDTALQGEVFAQLDARLRPGGYLVIGAHERLPRGADGYRPLREGLPIYRKGLGSAG